jgi:signal transduction histidine kinase
VACARAGGRFTITVTNDGNPFKVPAKKKQGMGLSLLRHRAHLLGGEVTFEPLAAGGCRMVCDIPEPVPRNHKNGNTATTHRPGGEGDGG